MGSIRSSYALNFLNPTLDPSLTFSRASSATMYNSSGLLVYAPMNLLLYSNNFSNANWSKGTGSTVNGQTATDPFGVANNAWSVTLGNTGAGLYQSAGTSAVNIPLTTSVWLQTTNGQNATVYLHAGSIANGQYITVTPQWQRFSVNCSPASVSQYFEIRTDYPSQQPTVTLNMYGAQVEFTSIDSPHAYNPTTSSVYYGPRFDYNPTTLALNGLLMEIQSTNLMYPSIPVSPWGASAGATLTPNVAVSPDGTMNASSINDGTSSSTHFIGNSGVSYTSSLNYTTSAFVQAGTATVIQLVCNQAAFGNNAYANYNLSAGTVSFTGSAISIAGIQTLPNGWYRIWATAQATSTQANQTPYFVLVNNNPTAALVPTYTGANQTLYIYGVQVEQYIVPTSYIPTLASSVTRATDLLANTSISGWYNPVQGTLAVEGIYYNPYNINIFATFDDGSQSNRWQITQTASKLTTTEQSGGTVYLSNPETFATSTNTVYKFAASLKANQYYSSANGATPYTTTGTIVMPANVSQLELGAVTQGYNLNGWLRSFSYWNTALSASQVQTISGQL